MLDAGQYLRNLKTSFPAMLKEYPWIITRKIQQIITEKIPTLNSGFTINGNVAIHKTAEIEEHSIIKGPAIISANCFIAAHAYLRGGVFLGEGVTLGPGCEVKSSIILEKTSLAHFNFAGDSMIGAHVNLEAGAVIANHYNEREQKEISALLNGKPFNTKVTKFGALIGDHSKIGANAVLSPGTILEPGSIIKRLTLVEQCK